MRIKIVPQFAKSSAILDPLTESWGFPAAAVPATAAMTTAESFMVEDGEV